MASMHGVEVPSAVWRKGSRSSAQGSNCVEIARIGAKRAVRDSKNPRGNGWNIAAIKPDRVQTRFHDDDAPAWLATINQI